VLVAEGAAGADREAHSAALIGLGASGVLLGDAELAQGALVAACEILAEIGDEPGLSEALTYRARLAREAGQLADARALLEEADRRVATEGYQRDRAFALMELARVELEQGSAGEALVLAELSRALAADQADCAAAAEATVVAAESGLGRAAEALASADHLVERRRRGSSMAWERPWAWRAAAEAYQAAGLAERARATADTGWGELLTQADGFQPDVRLRFLDLPDQSALRRLASGQPG
jgi:tetratricopeptide (TPR) repeat protein